MFLLVVIMQNFKILQSKETITYPYLIYVSIGGDYAKFQDVSMKRNCESDIFNYAGEHQWPNFKHI